MYAYYRENNGRATAIRKFDADAANHVDTSKTAEDSPSTNKSYIPNLNSTSDSGTAFVTCSSVTPPVVPFHGHNSNLPSASAALELRGIHIKDSNPDVKPNSTTLDGQQVVETNKRGRHVVRQSQLVYYKWIQIMEKLQQGGIAFCKVVEK